MKWYKTEAVPPLRKEAIVGAWRFVDGRGLDEPLIMTVEWWAEAKLWVTVVGQTIISEEDPEQWTTVEELGNFLGPREWDDDLDCSDMKITMVRIEEDSGDESGDLE